MCGSGVTSVILFIRNPQPFKALIEDSLPAPGPLTLTSTFTIPMSFAIVPALSAAICAAKGVLFLEPLNPDPPDVAQQTALPVSYTHLTLPTTGEV